LPLVTSNSSKKSWRLVRKLLIMFSPLKNVGLMPGY
jgi:hypothetical protein